MIHKSQWGRLAGRLGKVAGEVLVFGFAAGWAAGRSGRGRRREVIVGRLPTAITRLGPTYLKLAQILATRRDVVPPDVCDALGQLHDAVPPMREAELAQALAEQYPAGHSHAFAHFDRRPVACGSIACVYRATTTDGQDVAVKVRRPRVAQTMRTDLQLLEALAALVQRVPQLSRVPLTEIVGQLAEVLMAQVDLERERAALRDMRTNLSVVPRVWVPRVIQDLSTPGCLVTEYIDDLHPRYSAPAGVKRKKFAESALESIYRMLFLDGLVHCDMHPGNLYFLSSGQVVLLDAGFSIRLDTRVRLLFANFFLNMALGRGERAAGIVVESSLGLEPGADVDQFIAAMSDLVERSHGQSAQEFSLIRFATEMFELQRRFGIKSAPEIVFPLLALLVIEGTIRDLDPDVDFQEAAKPTLHRALFARHA